jgi:hypothetical protein
MTRQQCSAGPQDVLAWLLLRLLYVGRDAVPVQPLFDHLLAIDPLTPLSLAMKAAPTRLSGRVSSARRPTASTLSLHLAESHVVICTAPAALDEGPDHRKRTPAGREHSHNQVSGRPLANSTANARSLPMISSAGCRLRAIGVPPSSMPSPEYPIASGPV